MTEKSVPPDLQEAEMLLTDLFEDVKKWEGTLAGGTKLDVGAAAVDSLFQTKVSFGNPRDNLIRLTKKSFKEAGAKLTSVRREQMKDRRFYYMTVTVHLQPKPGAQFKALFCRLDLGPKGPDEPIVQAIFPKSEWHTVMNWGGGMSLGLNGNLEWSAGVDASKVAEIANLPGNLKANVANRNELKAVIAIPDYAYDVGRFDIAATGEGTSECYWHIQEPDLQKLLTVQFAIVFKVPKKTKSVTLHGITWAEPSMNWLVANVRNVFRDLGDKLQALLKRKDEAAIKFARGAAEEWTLKLPK